MGRSSQKARLIHLSYIGEDSWPLHEQLLEHLDRNPDIKLAFQPGTFHYKWGKVQNAIHKRSYMTLMNREEAMDVTGQPYEPLRGLANGLRDLGSACSGGDRWSNGSDASYDYKFWTIP